MSPHITVDVIVRVIYCLSVRRLTLSILGLSGILSATACGDGGISPHDLGGSGGSDGLGSDGDSSGGSADSDTSNGSGGGDTSGSAGSGGAGDSQASGGSGQGDGSGGSTDSDSADSAGSGGSRSGGSGSGGGDGSGGANSSSASNDEGAGGTSSDGSGGSGGDGMGGVGGDGVGGLGTDGGGGTGGSGGDAGTGGAGTGGADTGGTATGGAGTDGSSGGSTGSGGDGSDGSGGTGGVTCSPQSPPAIDRLGLETVVTDDRFERLVDARQAPGSDDWYLVDQVGYIYLYRDGQLLDDPFLDLSGEIEIGAAPFNVAVKYDDRGLVGLEFSPDYQENGLFYVAVVPSADGTVDEDTDLVREYTRSEDDPDLADPTPTKTLVALPSAPEAPGVTFTVMHNTSTLLFGPDGMLYVGTGDGGTTTCNAAQPDAPQRLDNVYGKILRLDPSADPPYAAADNPFVDDEDADPRVLHYGLRNPFRFGIDRLTGDLYIGDVGQFSYEEVSYAPFGAEGLNFGWAAFEGLVNTCSNRALRAGSTPTDPMFVTDRRNGATGPFADYVSAMGGGVYRGSAIPELYGAAIFGDFEGDRMAVLYNCGPNEEDRSDLTIVRKSCNANFPDEACFVPTDDAGEFVRLYGFVQGNDQEFYMIINHDSLRKIVPAPTD